MNDLSDIDNLSRQIEELMREKQQVISIVSHDLRSPLNRIFALIQLLQMNSSNLTAEQKDYLERMHLVIADGLVMMRNLVDYRNLEFREIDTHPETFNVCSFLESIVKSFRLIAAKKDIELNIECESNLTVTTDKQCLGRVVDNLLSNAVKFSPSGKKVWVRADTLFINHLKIEVQDEAPGFLPEEVPMLFQKFRKFSTPPTGGESSTGLGLFVARSMAEKIGGKITCVTTSRVGSTFSIELPKSVG